MSQTLFESVVSAEDAGLRLDVYLSEHIGDASRSLLKKIIKDNRVTVGGGVCKRPSRNVKEGDSICADIPPPPSTEHEPEDIPIDILYEDADLVIVDKPSGLVVHPAPGHYSGTLVNAILHHCPDFLRPGEDAARPGIVHRLDRYTSGVMVVAKTPEAFAHLAKQAREHTFDRRYLALIEGEFAENAGKITAALGRSMVDRTRMTVTPVRGREAVTRFEVLERFGVASLIALQLETGRTHQIRAHLRFAGRRVLGDSVYGVDDFSKWRVSPPVRSALKALEGQALHAELLGIEHPRTRQRQQFTAPPPKDFQTALDALREAHNLSANTRE